MRERGMGSTGFTPGLGGPGARRLAPCRARRGTTLVEILVAMVILLLGIFSLVQLFPTGFTSILYGRSVSQAQALTNGMVQAARLNASELPDLVEVVNPITGKPFPWLPVT